MSENFNILMVSAECAPYAKSGGLGDVVGALPHYLAELGCNVIVVMPMYSFIDAQRHNISPSIGFLDVWLAGDLIRCEVRKSSMQDIPVYLIDYEPFFGRPGMYHDSSYNDYHDNPLRFSFLSKAALELCHLLNFIPDIVHANDWHTAMIPAFIKRFHRNDIFLKRAATVLTIHNIAYQGRYNRYYYFATGLGWEDFTQDKFEHYHDVNFLKGGIHFADVVNTVSKGYANETRTPPLGYGLEYFLNLKGDDYTGILNGADYSLWNPETDTLLPFNYSLEDMSGKAICKQKLQVVMGLEQFADTPVIGIISRLAEQKGFYLIAECIEDLIGRLNVQFAVLGSGDNNLENFFRGLPARYPGKVGVFIAYDNELAHLIEAGSDLFLMPSIYEPCGLNQIYSLKYGTLPIVRATGGLNDTIENYNQETGEGTGFKFWEPSCQAASNTIEWAVETYLKKKEHFDSMVRRAMQEEFSWSGSALEYLKLYKKALGKII